MVEERNIFLSDSRAALVFPKTIHKCLYIFTLKNGRIIFTETDKAVTFKKT